MEHSFLVFIFFVLHSLMSDLFHIFQVMSSKFYEKAEEYGRFNLGSTVVLLFPESINLDWSTSITTGQKIKFGECIAKVR